MLEAREVNGHMLIPFEAYRLDNEYLITRAPGYQWHVSRVSSPELGTLTLELVDTWYELTDAVQSALAHRQSR